MFLPALVYPFHRLFSHKDEKNAPGPGKVPAASEEQNGTNNNLRSPQSTLNAYIFPSSISHNPQNRHPILESDQPPARTRAVVPHITIENPAASSQDDSIRVLPLISSVFVPFAILLAIPGLTDHWYIRTNDQHQTVGFEANPLYIQVMLGFSMACAIITNACLVIRLCEKMVKNMTILCIVALSIHDTLDAIVLIKFIIKTQNDDGFSLGQAFWMTLCSTFASLVTNVTLILDYWRTSERHKSGLTEKQRSLTIIIIVLLCYVAFGAAVHTALLSLSFIDALYFTVVCIETVGFGDFNPQTPGARIFSSFYTVFGILILAVAIGLIREALLEAIQHNQYARIRRSRKQRIMKRWTVAVKWRLDKARLPVWVPVDKDKDFEWPREMEIRNGRWQPWSHLAKWNRHSRHSNNEEIELTPRPRARSMRLNLRALSKAQLQAAAMEAGAPLQELLPRHPDHYVDIPYYCSHGSEVISPTQHRLGHMMLLVRNFAYAVSVGQTPAPSRFTTFTDGSGGEEIPSDQNLRTRMNSPDERLTFVELEREERRMFAIRITIALSLFLTFWLVGSVIFSVTEKWSFWLSFYFCYLTFSTVGFGDPVPRTPAGRSFFVGWALCGIATMTILISLLADQYSERYKGMIFAAGSTADNDNDTGRRDDVTPPGSSSDRVIPRNSKTTDEEKPMNISDEGGNSSSNEVASRLDSLKAVIVQGRPKEETLDVLEGELQNMLLLIRRSRKRPSQGE